MRALLSLAVVCGVVAAGTPSRAEQAPFAEDIEARRIVGSIDTAILRADWAEVSSGARAIRSCTGVALIRSGNVLLPAQRILRARLAHLPEDGRSALAKDIQELRRQIYDEAIDADRRGDLLRAAIAWRELLDQAGDHGRDAAKRLVALSEEFGDPLLAAEAEPTLRTEPLAERMRIRGLMRNRPALAPCAVTSWGSIAQLGSLAELPTHTGARISLPSAEVDGFEWRHDHIVSDGFGKDIPQMRRLLAPSAATRDLLLVHMGMSVLAYDGEGEVRWKVGPWNVLRFLGELVEAPLLSQQGIALEGSFGYATLARMPAGHSPRSRLARFSLEDGREVWSTNGTKTKLVFTGTPLPDGERVFCGAETLDAPTETWVVALSAEDGAIVWRRALARSEPQGLGQRGAMPRVAPAPALSFMRGVLMVASGNGVLAALERATGEPLWVSCYESQECACAQDLWTAAQHFSQAGPPNNPPLQVAGYVLVVPRDTGDLMLIRLVDGTPMSKWAQRRRAMHVLGVADGQVVGAAADGVWLLSFVADGRELETRRVRAGLGFRGDLVGAPVLVNDAVLVPTASGVNVIRLDGKQSAALTWRDAEKERGDLVLGDGSLWVVGARNAHAFAFDD